YVRHGKPAILRENTLQRHPGSVQSSESLLQSSPIPVRRLSHHLRMRIGFVSGRNLGRRDFDSPGHGPGSLEHHCWMSNLYLFTTWYTGSFCREVQLEFASGKDLERLNNHELRSIANALLSAEAGRWHVPLGDLDLSKRETDPDAG